MNEQPQTGGSYTRDPNTGELRKTEHDPVQAQKPKAEPKAAEPKEDKV